MALASGQPIADTTPHAPAKRGPGMIPSPCPGFAIRENPDGSLDAICLKCSATAGSTMTESKLSEIEESHRCDPALLMARSNTVLKPSQAE
jgi:hypothetical protein